MRERIISGATLLILLAAIVLFDSSFPPVINIVVSIITALAVYEMVKALGLQKKLFITIPAVLTAALTPFLVIITIGKYPLLLLYCAFTLTLFLAMLRHHETVSFQEIAMVYSMVIIIPMGLSMLVRLRGLSTAHGVFFVLIAIMSSWISDAGAYFAGTLFGKHKLCPKISPNKTVEGFAGGIVVNILAMLLFGLLYQNGNKDIKVNLVIMGVIGLVGSLVSVLGDLSFSLIKRSCNIKDFGQVIPGHGGMLDRFDSVIFNAPVVYIILGIMSAALVYPNPI